VNFSRLGLGLVFAAAFALSLASAGLAQYGPASPAPAPSGSGGPTRGHRPPKPSPSPEATATPAPPQFDTIDGTWEIEVQPLLQRLANYSWITIKSNGSTLTGTWTQTHGKFGMSHAPMAGTFDGRLISMTVLLPNGDTATFNGYVEEFGDMVGLFAANAKDQGTAFTGQHRKK
jgi:hypothetical protein